MYTHTIINNNPTPALSSILYLKLHDTFDRYDNINYQKKTPLVPPSVTGVSVFKVRAPLARWPPMSPQDGRRSIAFEIVGTAAEEEKPASVVGRGSRRDSAVYGFCSNAYDLS